MEFGPGPQLVDHVKPGALVACEAVDKDHRDPPRLVGLEKLKPRLRVTATEGLDKALETRRRHPGERVE